jgi:uncharacterized protein
MSTLIGLGALSLLVLWIGKRKGFFVLPDAVKEWKTPIHFLQLLIAFAIYLSITFIASTFLILYFRPQVIGHYVAYSTWFNFSVSSIILISLLLYLKLLPSSIRRGIWDRDRKGDKVEEDLKTAGLAWVLAFPFVIFLSDLLETVVEKVFHVKGLPDQLAVYFLKSTFHDPLYFLLACSTITILAPCVEETLFRGFLQSYLRRYLGSYGAILLTAFCFSLFHFSLSQGLANIPILGSLFFLAFFLGFVYEKRGSLLASISLHSIFNSVSILNLYLFGQP